MQGASE